jgi:hypothetical protein
MTVVDLLQNSRMYDSKIGEMTFTSTRLLERMISQLAQIVGSFDLSYLRFRQLQGTIMAFITYSDRQAVIHAECTSCRITPAARSYSQNQNKIHLPPMLLAG